jgi:hypothetical protein
VSDIGMHLTKIGPIFTLRVATPMGNVIALREHQTFEQCCDHLKSFGYDPVIGDIIKEDTGSLILRCQPFGLRNLAPNDQPQD